MVIGPSAASPQSPLNIAALQRLQAAQPTSRTVVTQQYIPKTPTGISQLSEFRNNPNYTVTENPDGSFKVLGREIQYTISQEDDRINYGTYIQEEYVFNDQGDFVSGVKRDEFVVSDRVSSGGVRRYSERPFDEVIYSTSGDVVTKTTYETIGRETSGGQYKESVKFMEREQGGLSGGGFELVESRTNLTQTQKFNQGLLAKQIDPDTGRTTYVPIGTPGSEISGAANTALVAERLESLGAEFTIDKGTIDITKYPDATGTIFEQQRAIAQTELGTITRVEREAGEITFVGLGKETVAPTGEIFTKTKKTFPLTGLAFGLADKPIFVKKEAVKKKKKEEDLLVAVGGDLTPAQEIVAVSTIFGSDVAPPSPGVQRLVSGIIGDKITEADRQLVSEEFKFGGGKYDIPEIDLRKEFGKAAIRAAELKGERIAEGKERPEEFAREVQVSAALLLQRETEAERAILTSLKGTRATDEEVASSLVLTGFGQLAQRRSQEELGKLTEDELSRTITVQKTVDKEGIPTLLQFTVEGERKSTEPGFFGKIGRSISRRVEESNRELARKADMVLPITELKEFFQLKKDVDTRLAELKAQEVKDIELPSPTGAVEPIPTEPGFLAGAKEVLIDPPASGIGRLIEAGYLGAEALETGVGFAREQVIGFGKRTAEVGKAVLAFQAIKFKQRLDITKKQAAAVTVVVGKQIEIAKKVSDVIDTPRQFLIAKKEEFDIKALSFFMGKPIDSPEVQAEIRGMRIMKEKGKFGPFAYLDPEFRAESNRQLGKITKSVLPDLEPRFRTEQQLLRRQRVVLESQGRGQDVFRSRGKEFLLGLGTATFTEARERPTNLVLLFGVGKIASGAFKAIGAIKGASFAAKTARVAPKIAGVALGAAFVGGVGIETALTRPQDRPLVLGKRITQFAAVAAGAGPSLKGQGARRELARLQKVETETLLQARVIAGTKITYASTKPVGSAELLAASQGSAVGRGIVKPRAINIDKILQGPKVTGLTGRVTGKKVDFDVSVTAVNRRFEATLISKKYVFKFAKAPGAKDVKLTTISRKTGKVVFRDIVKQQPKLLDDFGKVLKQKKLEIETPLGQLRGRGAKATRIRPIKKGDELVYSVQEVRQELLGLDAGIKRTLIETPKRITLTDRLTLKGFYARQVDRLGVRTKSPFGVAQKEGFTGKIDFFTKGVPRGIKGTELKAKDPRALLTQATLVVSKSGRQDPLAKFFLQETTPGRGGKVFQIASLPPKVDQTTTILAQKAEFIFIRNIPKTRLFKLKRFVATKKGQVKTFLTASKIKALTTISAIRTAPREIGFAISTASRNLGQATVKGAKQSLLFIKQAPGRIQRGTIEGAKASFRFVKDTSVKGFKDTIAGARKGISFIREAPGRVGTTIKKTTVRASLGLKKGAKTSLDVAREGLRLAVEKQPFRRRYKSMFADKRAGIEQTFKEPKLKFKDAKVKLKQPRTKQQPELEKVFVRQIKEPRIRFGTGDFLRGFESLLFEQVGIGKSVIAPPIIIGATRKKIFQERISIVETELSRLSIPKRRLDIGAAQVQIPVAEVEPVTIPESVLDVGTTTTTAQLPVVTPTIPVPTTPLPPVTVPTPEITLPEPEPTVKAGLLGFPLFDDPKGGIKNRNKYNVEVKEKGKWIKVNQVPVPYIKGKNLGADVVDNTPSASFRLKKLKQKSRARDDNVFLKSGLFRKSKTDKRIFVEKDKYRINTVGEVQGISVKGYLERKRRARTFRL